jgi:anti-sigma factor RsiW
MPDTPFACEPYVVDLSALIDGELQPSRAAEVREHLSACEGCSQRFAVLRGVDRVLAATPMPEVPAGLRARLQERIESSPEREEVIHERRAAPRVRGRFIRPAIGVAVALAASTLVYLAVLPEPAFDSGSEAPVVAPIEETEVALVGEPSGEAVVGEQPVELELPVVVAIEETEVALVREPSSEEVVGDEPVVLEPSVAVVDTAIELEAASDEELAVLLQLEMIQNLDVIANLEMLERLMVVGEGAS